MQSADAYISLTMPDWLAGQGSMSVVLKRRNKISPRPAFRRR
jgi:hypothetical protein